ncbi:MAG: hypothetical protein ACRCX2_29125 [Paraclostridium sp.]
MEQTQCLNCKKMIQVEKIEKGTEVLCECGCKQKCLDKDGYAKIRVVC